VGAGLVAVKHSLLEETLQFDRVILTLDAVLRVAHVRAVNWSKHDTDRVGVGIDGMQYLTHVTRGITLHSRSRFDDMVMTGDEARELAVRLLEAADEYDRLEQAHPIVREET